MRRIITFFIFYSVYSDLFAEYMYDVAEDSDGTPFTGIVGLFLFFGIIWLISTFKEHNKEENEKRERDKRILTQMEKEFSKQPIKYCYRHYPEWRKGYLKAYYLFAEGYPLKECKKNTVKDLLNEYHNFPFVYYSCDKTKEIMEQIGYYQCAEWIAERKNREPIK